MARNGGVPPAQHIECGLLRSKPANGARCVTADPRRPPAPPCRSKPTSEAKSDELSKAQKAKRTRQKERILPTEPFESSFSLAWAGGSAEPRNSTYAQHFASHPMSSYRDPVHPVTTGECSPSHYGASPNLLQPPSPTPLPSSPLFFLLRLMEPPVTQLPQPPPPRPFHPPLLLARSQPMEAADGRVRPHQHNGLPLHEGDEASGIPPAPLLHPDQGRPPLQGRQTGARNNVRDQVQGRQYESRGVGKDEGNAAGTKGSPQAEHDPAGERRGAAQEHGRDHVQVRASVRGAERNGDGGCGNVMPCLHQCTTGMSKQARFDSAGPRVTCVSSTRVWALLAGLVARVAAGRSLWTIPWTSNGGRSGQRR